MSDEPWFSLRGIRDLEPSPEPGDDPILSDGLRQAIRRDGPMTFARFMEIALYDPDRGYYASGERGPGRASDFLTAPESHPIFGWALGRQVEEVWERLGHPVPFTIREYGAGTGALAAGIMDGLTRSRSALRGVLRYRIAERGADRERQVRARLAAVGSEDAFESDGGGPIVGVVLANEVLDALPIHRVVGIEDGGIVELFVDLDAAGTFHSVEGEPSSAGLAARLAREGVRLAEGQQAEICLEIDPWISNAARGLERGAMVLIDYGHPATALYLPDRGSLLRAYLRHRVHDDPFRNIGRQDLTTHVDLTAVASAATRAGLDALGMTTQAEFLTSLQAGDLLVALQAEAGIDLESYLLARSAFIRLLDPKATGNFAVMLLGRGVPDDPPLRGMSYRLDRTHRP